MEVDDIVAKLVVLRLYGFEILAEDLIVSDLFFKLLDIAFLSLSECSLGASQFPYRNT